MSEFFLSRFLLFSIYSPKLLSFPCLFFAAAEFEFSFSFISSCKRDVMYVPCVCIYMCEGERCKILD